MLTSFVRSARNFTFLDTHDTMRPVSRAGHALYSDSDSESDYAPKGRPPPSGITVIVLTLCIKFTCVVYVWPVL